MSPETEEQKRARHRRNQQRYRERALKSGGRNVQFFMDADDLAALDAVKAKRGFRSRAEAIASLARENLHQLERSEATS